MKPYEYQSKVIEACKKDPSPSQLISMPTGTGKTITFLLLAKEFNKKTLILVHREELLNQTHEKALLCGFKEDEIAFIKSTKKEKFNKINIAMVQTLSRNLDKYSPGDVEMVIVDEAHHALASSYLTVFEHFRIFSDKKYIFGFTATPLRGDKGSLSSIFHSHSFKMTLSEATKLGYIVPVNGILVQIEKSLSDINSVSGDYDISQLDKVMNCESINELVAQKCENLRKLPGIVFCTSIQHAKNLAEVLRKKGKKAIHVSCELSKKSVDRILRFLRLGKIDFITNAVKLSEGFDFPPIQSVILARPTRSPVLYKQMIGRGLRNHPGKFDCFVLEFTSNDPTMMKWEDIDENCTFQSYSENKKKTEDEAKQKYKSIFPSPNITILDVRISPFDFYECKLRRLVKYKKFNFYIPIEEGFCFYTIINSSEAQFANFFNLYATVLFWKEKYKSFYVWDIPNYQMMEGNTIDECKKCMQHYASVNKMGKWYPSELQKPTREQRLKLKSFNINDRKISSARKAEMEIEDYAIQECISKYLEKGLFSGVMEIF